MKRIQRRQRASKRASAINRVPRLVTGASLLGNGTGFPRRLQTTLRYVDTNVVTTGAGVPGSYVFSCNGCFDPNITGTGHQPLYFDQLMLIYDHYTVVASRVEHQVLTSLNANVVLYIDDDTSLAADGGHASEQPTGQSVLVSSLATVPTIFKRSWDAKSYFGGNIFDNDNLQGTSAANPVEQSYFVLMMQPLTAAAATVNFATIIEYDVVFDELKTIVGS
jgi:hypothetical protein